MTRAIKDLELFIADWEDTEEQNKKSFLILKDYLESKTHIRIEFIPRPGVTYSLRASHIKQKERTLFVMVDVIDETVRWLSVCFYGDTIKDPEEKGDFVPEGLLGEDAVCFDLDEYNKENLEYIKARLDEAYISAGSPAC